MRSVTIILCLAGLGLAMLAGCAASPSGPQAPLAPTQPMTSPSITNTASAATLDVTTGDGVYPRTEGTEFVQLVGVTDRVTDKQQVFVDWGETYTARDWRSYYKAAGDSAQPYEFVQASRSGPQCDAAQACTFTERYRISIPPREMLLAARTGLSFDVYSRRGGTRTVTVSPEIAAAFNDRMAEAARLAGRGHGGT